jgi:hypothetical protein
VFLIRTIGGESHVAQAKAIGCQGRSNASEYARAVFAHDDHVIDLCLLRTDLYFDRPFSFQESKQAEVTGNLRGRTAIQVRSGHAAEVHLYQVRVQLRTLLPYGFGQGAHSDHFDPK